MSWEVHDAAALAARKDIATRLPPCPNCGAPVDLESIGLLDVTTYGDPVPQFLHHTEEPLECSARCWEKDPWAYLKAVKS